ncbi:hypothetical protein OIDMADRAFT_16694 [Oidiodendron maius Zn]|uniref:Uncharacterized protein n=1 Tax=Oidiodendron maius (strain Zn) TaxID=913774 RepID=A0A0C3I2H5_OIDMZ|nr:hypothetical protein OIDMADRAFT_16694 [Oidiodendron maius Zn]
MGNSSSLPYIICFSLRTPLIFPTSNYSSTQIRTLIPTRCFKISTPLSLPWVIRPLLYFYN